MDLYEDWQKNSKVKLKEHQTFLKRLKKQKKGKQIDQIVNDLDERAFEHFDCLDCANCCKTISPVVTATDVKRIGKHLRIKETEVIEHYLNVDHEGDYVMNKQPCPFLGSDNYCSIYEARPKACREYPLTQNQGFNQRPALHARNTITCPVVFHVVKELKKNL
ncbi:YkgJ family cysteine cluster protein [Flammeovirga pacifica]|uniref:Zinc/iron-chelating domain-containing protein n=1 Tax=Flammeovirga pacifica TaxID=915059 RepID=A0A1S1Z4T7_FLAPC|nr:YkgJ family cysteine cluster protein [Flammeovirga pacifica]OHX68299.1 zinc/iron-chelating domain-containing protein [Flammeovirga pacifica]